MAYVKCPFCLNMHNITAASGYQCPECGKQLPDEYVENYRDMPPIWLAMVGFSQHGKTTFLAALTLMLEDISKVWKAFSHYLDDDYTTSAVIQMRQDVEEGKPLERTEKVQPPLMIQMNNVPESGSHMLIMYDVAGQDYLKADVHTVIPFMKHVNTVWFFVSPGDFDKDKQQHTLTDLFESYTRAMRKLHVSDLTGRNLLVIYTKADEYPDDLDSDPEKDLKKYIMEDPYATLGQRGFHPDEVSSFSLSDYATKMKQNSQLLMEYTKRRFRDGERFIKMVKKHSNMNLEFCITSALPGGHNPKTGKINMQEIPRYRVLDPFLWTLLLNESDESKPYYLIISNNTDTQLATNIWKKLSSYGVTKVYHLGSTRPLTQPEQIQISKATFSRPDLIGPILDNSEPDTRIIVFADNPIIDLADFRGTTFADRLLVVSTNVDEQFSWSHVLIYRPEFDENIIVDALLSLEGGSL
jgi:hypothetical protein